MTAQKYFTWGMTIFAFLLPWQTRYIFGPVAPPVGSEFTVASVYVTELLLVIGLLIGYAYFGKPRLKAEYVLPVKLGAGIIGYAFLLTLVSGVFPSLAQFLHLFAAAAFFAALLDERVQVRQAVQGFVFGLVIPVVLGAWQILTGGSGASTLLGLATRDARHLGDSVIMLADGTRMLRAYGSFPHPNIFGGFLAVGFVSAAWLYFSTKSKRLAVRALYLVMLIMILLGLFLTFSRSAMLGLILGTGLGYLVIRMKNTARARLLVIPLAVLVIGSAVLSPIIIPKTLASLRGGGALEERSVTERLEQYQEWSFIQTSGNKPVLRTVIGHGLGTYVPSSITVPSLEAWEYQPVHSVPLLILFDIGLIGAVIVISWSSSIDRINFRRFPNRDAVAAFAMGNVVLVILFFDHYLWSSWSGLALIAFVMALTVRMGEAEVS